MGENGTPDTRSEDTTADIRLAVAGSDLAVTPDDPATVPAAFGAVSAPLLPSEQLARLADTSAATLAGFARITDAERTPAPEALARVLDAVEASMLG